MCALVTGVQTCALPILERREPRRLDAGDQRSLLGRSDDLVAIGEARKQRRAEEVCLGRGVRRPRGGTARHSGSEACARSCSTKSVWRGGSKNNSSVGSEIGRAHV